MSDPAIENYNQLNNGRNNHPTNKSIQIIIASQIYYIPEIEFLTELLGKRRRPLLSQLSYRRGLDFRDFIIALEELYKAISKLGDLAFNVSAGCYAHLPWRAMPG
jgi:hypothetical protein